MRRLWTGAAVGLLLGGAGCNTCGDRPRLFDALRNRDESSSQDPGCRDVCPPTGRNASMQRLGAPVRGQGASFIGPVGGMPPVTAFPAPPPGGTLTPADQLPMPGPGTNIPPAGVPLSPVSPAVPGAALLPAPSVRPAGR